MLDGDSENYETDSQYPEVDDEVAYESSTYWEIKCVRKEIVIVKDVLLTKFQDLTWADIATFSHWQCLATDSSGRIYFFKNYSFLMLIEKLDLILYSKKLFMMKMAR